MAAAADVVKRAQDARLWKRELQLADKREKEWREKAEKIVKRYESEEKKRNRYNVVWAVTEILSGACYNSKPEPDVRRRFRDSDPVGKAVSEILERGLNVVLDYEDTEDALDSDVLEGFLVGRGISRVRYDAKIKQTPREATESVPDPDARNEVEESIEGETCCIEHVDWRDFRHGFGRMWAEVSWVGFRHKLTGDDAKEKFEEADIGSVKFTVPVVDDSKKPGDETTETQKIAEFWEIWDKTGNRVFFLQEDCAQLLFPKDNPEGAPPLTLDGFFPCPQPLRLVVSVGSQKPIPHFNQYEEQADQLDRISARIDKIVEEMKVRGAYDARVPELKGVTDAHDGELVPIQNAAAYMEGGLDKAITWMPTDQLVAVLQQLYEARREQKAVIDEVTGISDIVRGNTDPDETASAQKLKSSYASVRLRRMQRRVRRYMRDLLRLAAQVIATKFGPDTLSAMTDLKFPTAEQKALLQMQMQQAQQAGQPVDPNLLKVPSWDEIMQLMRSQVMRQYRTDVETDSTIAETIDSDATGLAQVLQAVSQTLTELAPLVQSQALPVEAAKELVMTVVRRARMGSAVEDSFEKLKAPQPPPQPPDHSVQVAQIKAESDQKIAQMKEQGDEQRLHLQAQVDTLHQQLEAQRNKYAEDLKNQREQLMHEQQLQADSVDSQLQAQKEFVLEQQKASNSLMESKLDAAVRIIVAQIQAKAQEQAAAASAEREVTTDLQ
jgi:hypothetical protein